MSREREAKLELRNEVRVPKQELGNQFEKIPL
jgi:hypothetical protein